jgi:hypothetical protein
MRLNRRSGWPIDIKSLRVVLPLDGGRPPGALSSAWVPRARWPKRAAGTRARPFPVMPFRTILAIHRKLPLSYIY